MLSASKSSIARDRKSPVAGRLVRIGHQAFEADARQVHRETAKLASRLRRLHAVPPEAGVALDQDRHVAAVTDARLGKAADDGVVVGDHGKPLHPRRKLHQAIGLRFADDVEGEEDVVGHAGIDEDPRLAELLAGDADRAGRHLHLADLRDLVGLDVRPVADALLGKHGLNARDIRFEPVEENCHCGGVEFAHKHKRFLAERTAPRLTLHDIAEPGVLISRHPDALLSGCITRYDLIIR